MKDIGYVQEVSEDGHHLLGKFAFTDIIRATFIDHRLVTVARSAANTFCLVVENPSSSGRGRQAKIHLTALAEQGVGGERSAAERLLNSLMEQYGISPEDLDSDVVEYHLAYIGEQRSDWRLFSQIAHKLHEGCPGKVRIADLRKAPAGLKKTWAEAGLGPKNSNVGLRCTKAEFVEVMSTFEIYREDMHRQEDNFFYAYLDKNNLLLVPDGDQPELTEEEIKKLKAAALMAKGIERKEIYKQIEGK